MAPLRLGGFLTSSHHGNGAAQVQSATCSHTLLTSRLHSDPSPNGAPSRFFHTPSSTTHRLTFTRSRPSHTVWVHCCRSCSIANGLSCTSVSCASRCLTSQGPHGKWSILPAQWPWRARSSRTLTAHAAHRLRTCWQCGEGVHVLVGDHVRVPSVMCMRVKGCRGGITVKAGGRWCSMTLRCA